MRPMFYNYRRLGIRSFPVLLAVALLCVLSGSVIAASAGDRPDIESHTGVFIAGIFAAVLFGGVALWFYYFVLRKLQLRRWKNAVVSDDMSPNDAFRDIVTKASPLWGVGAALFTIAAALLGFTLAFGAAQLV